MPKRAIFGRMQSYGDYCPIARGAEIFATRWTPIIVRNLLLGCSTFSEIRAGAPGIPKSLLSDRLRMLEKYEVIISRPNPNRRGRIYELTPAGRELQEVCDALGTWGSRWLELGPMHIDAGIVLWGLSQTLEGDQLPDHLLNIRFDVSDDARGRYWFLFEPPNFEVCFNPPGHPEDLVVTTTSEWLAKWHTGGIGLGQAMHAGRIRVEGPRHLIRLLAGWGGMGTMGDPVPGSLAARS